MANGPARASQRLLVVDDDERIVALIRRYFATHGYCVDTVADAAAMRRALVERPVDLVLLDLGLPGEEGFDLVRALRSEWQGAIVIVTGRGEAVDRVVGLELGADDYVTKPFDLRELLARVRSVLRRCSGPGQVPAEGALFSFAGFQLDVSARKLTDTEGRPVNLTTGEYGLLRALLERPNRVLLRDDLVALLYGRAAGPHDRALDVQIGRLRRKIERDPAHPDIIKSVRGSGYLFAVRPVRR